MPSEIAQSIVTASLPMKNQRQLILLMMLALPLGTIQQEMNLRKTGVSTLVIQDKSCR